MNKQQVTFLETKPVSVFFDIKDKFEFRKDKKYHLIQKMLLWCLKKIGAYAQGEDIKLERYEFYADDFIYALLMQNENILNFYNYYGKKLLIGAEDFSQLMNSPKFNQIVSFDAKYHCGHRGSSGYSIHGLNVTVIPWMKGMLVVPKQV